MMSRRASAVAANARLAEQQTDSESDIAPDTDLQSNGDVTAGSSLLNPPSPTQPSPPLTAKKAQSFVRSPIASMKKSRVTYEGRKFRRVSRSSPGTEPATRSPSPDTTFRVYPSTDMQLSSPDHSTVLRRTKSAFLLRTAATVSKRKHGVSAATSTPSKRPRKAPQPPPTPNPTGKARTKSNTQPSYHETDIVLMHMNQTLSEFVQDDTEGVWWPAKILQTGPLNIKLFGSLTSPKFGDSLLDRRSVRPFGESRTHTSLLGHCSDKLLSNPSAFPPNAAERWSDALQEAEQAEKDSSELPSSMALLNRTYEEGSIASTPRSSRNRSTSPSNMKASSPTRSAAPLTPDPFLTIPGEKVLAKAKKQLGDYWPALVKEFVPVNGKAKYRVFFLDKKVYLIERDMFFTIPEEGFATCRMGDWQTDVDPLPYPDNQQELQAYFRQRSPTPEIADSIPCSLEQFRDLDLRAQFACTWPVLDAVLQYTFEPARANHDLFVAGGTKRASLINSQVISSKGSLTEREFEALMQEILWWTLGHERWSSQSASGQGGSEDKETTFASSRTRRRGCIDYETLTDTDRLQYCNTVLLHEAVLQLLLLRNGVRSSTSPLGMEVEALLRQKALALLKESDDWVGSIAAIKKMKDKSRPLAVPAPTDNDTGSRQGKRTTRTATRR